MAELTKTSKASETAGSVADKSPARLEDCVQITEGRAKILFPSSNEVFYNPVQEFNRDLRFGLYSFASNTIDIIDT